MLSSRFCAFAASTRVMLSGSSATASCTSESLCSPWEFAQIPWAIWRIAMIRHHLPCLHTINPDFAPTVAEMYESLGETSEWLTDMKEIGGFRIEARPVVNRVIPPLRQLFFSLTCGRHEFTASL